MGSIGTLPAFPPLSDGKNEPRAALGVRQDNQYNRCKISTGGPDSGARKRARKRTLTSKTCRQAALASAAFLVCIVTAEAAPKPAQPVPLPRPRPVAVTPKAIPGPAKATVKSTVPLAVASTTATGSDDLAAVRRAIDLVKRNKMSDAAEVGRSVTDPVARKLVEWAILRAEDDDFSFER